MVAQKDMKTKSQSRRPKKRAEEETRSDGETKGHLSVLLMIRSLTLCARTKVFPLSKSNFPVYDLSLSHAVGFTLG